jgi:hypothetical protein
MPLINGKEVSFTTKQTLSIQQDISKIAQIPDELKQQLSPEEMKSILPAEGVDVSNIGFFSGQEEEGLRNRKERYDLYREMDQMVFIHRAIETVCDDGVQMNDEGHALKFYSDDDDIKDRLDDLFNNRLNFDSNLWSVMYETIKMGDNFFEVIPDSYERPKKIMKLRFLEPQRVERIEVNGKLAYFIYRQDIKDNKNKKVGDKEYRLQPWQIIHFKVDNKEFEPYGGSLLTAGVRTYRRLALLEDVMLVYRISRSPERRVFYVDVGQLSPIEAKRFLQKFRDSYRTQQFIDENGKINKRAQVLSVTSDIFIPVREGGQGTKIDTLQAGQALNSMDDLKYFRDEILRTLNIPPDYLGDQSDRSRGALSTLDVKFSRYIERIQGYVESGLNKIAVLDLFFAGKKKDELQDFMIELTPPSNIKELTDIEFFNQKIMLIGAIIQLNLYPTKWILKKVMRLSDKEIADIMLYKQLEDQQKAQQQAQAQMGSGMPLGAGGIETPPTPPGAGGGAPPPEGTPGAEQNQLEVPVAGAEAMAPPGNTLGAVNAESLIQAFGQSFLVENQEDFFKILHASEDYKKNQKLITEEVKQDTDTLLEAISVAITGAPTVQKKKSKLAYLFSDNEFGGLTFNESKEPNEIKVYREKKKRGGYKEDEEVVFEESIISLKTKE